MTCICISVYAQIGGNQVYGNHNNNYVNSFNQSIQKTTITSTDSTLNLNARILLNKEADTYLLTVGVNQEAKTAIDCNKMINARIKSLKAALLPLGIKKDDIYVDFISQTKIYDYEIGDKQAEQHAVGYEIKKNINIRMDDIDLIDQLVERSAEQEIFDIIKVEYIDNNIQATYNQMYKEAIVFIKSRKKLFLETSSVELTDASRVLGDNFYAVYPKSQYKRYEAFETSNINVYRAHYSDDYISKETRKQATYYYEGVPTSGFDKIINASSPRIGIQYVLNLSMVFEIKKE